MNNIFAYCFPGRSAEPSANFGHELAKTQVLRKHKRMLLIFNNHTGKSCPGFLSAVFPSKRGSGATRTVTDKTLSLVAARLVRAPFGMSGQRGGAVLL
jgi:hypothetical protein